MTTPFPIERIPGTSGTNSPQTVSSPTRGRRVLHAAIVHYTGNASVTCLVTLNSGEGSLFDAVIGEIVLSAEQDGIFQPTTPLPLSDGDAIDFLCPALAAEESHAQLFMEVE